MIRPRTTPARRLVTLLLVAAVASGSCGVGTQDRPELLAADDVPDNLLDPNPPTTTTVPDDAAVTRVRVYFLETTADGETRLAPVEREIPLDQLGDLGARLNLLLQQPPTPEEAEQGYSSNIPPDTVVNDTTVIASRELAVVDLSPEFFDIQGQGQRSAFAQVVCTAVDAPAISRVQFTIDGEPRSALLGDGTQQRTVSCADYPGLQPER